MLTTIFCLLAWSAGMFGMFTYLKNLKETLKLSNVKTTLWLCGVIGIVLSIFAAFANLNHWPVYLIYVVGGAFLLYKFLDKKKLQMEISFAKSLTAKKDKDIWLVIGLSFATFMVMMCSYVFNTDLKHFMQRADAAWQVLGFILYLCSIASLFVLYFQGGVTTSKTNPGIIWIILLGLAIGASAGFNFDYFNLK